MDVKIQNFNSEEKYNIIKEGFTQEYKDVLTSKNTVIPVSNRHMLGNMQEQRWVSVVPSEHER